MIVKDYKARIIEIIILLSTVYYALSFVYPNFQQHIVISTMIMAVLLYIEDTLFDLFVIKIIKYKNFYTLIEKTMPIKKQK